MAPHRVRLRVSVPELALSPDACGVPCGYGGGTALDSILAKPLSVETGSPAGLEKKSDAINIEKCRFFDVFDAPILGPNTVSKASDSLQTRQLAQR